MIDNRLSTLLLALILIAYGVVGALYAILTPPWQAPDEPAHYNYVAQVAQEGCCPVIAPGDWDAAYLETLKAEQFPDDADLSAVEYEDHQPPLFYLVSLPGYLAGGGVLTALRLVSLIIGAGVVVAAYLVGRQLFPRHQTLALAAAAFVAFLPQHVAMMASVNNDSLAEVLGGFTLALSLAYLGNPVKPDGEGRSRPHPAFLGGLVGLAYLTKLTVYLPATVAVALAITLRWRGEKQTVRWLIAQTAWAAGPALTLGGLWWVRNVARYGWPDFLGQAAHAAVVVGQPRTAALVAERGFGPYLGSFLTTTYHSFWGQFGWMGVPMPPRVYLVTGVFGVVIAVGVALAASQSGGWCGLAWEARAGIGVLAGVALAAATNYLGYNLTFVQFQGRYLYPALIPAALAVALGGWGWAALACARLRGRLGTLALTWLPLAAVGWLPPLALYALFRFIVPNLG
jgi:4-amino-4-deoxy-L-arabinose transferase-like glycosyltransferase